MKGTTAASAGSFTTVLDARQPRCGSASILAGAEPSGVPVGEPFATRRDFLVGGALIATDCAFAQPDDLAPIADVERSLRGRVGFSALDTGSGRSIARRSGERFALCSTFKVPLAAAVLARIDAGAIGGKQMLRFERAQLLSVSPVSAAHADAEMMPVLTA
jgi:beta-lactamase class A